MEGVDARVGWVHVGKQIVGLGGEVGGEEDDIKFQGRIKLY